MKDLLRLLRLLKLLDYGYCTYKTKHGFAIEIRSSIITSVVLSTISDVTKKRTVMMYWAQDYYTLEIINK